MVLRKNSSKFSLAISMFMLDIIASRNGCAAQEINRRLNQEPGED